MDDYYHNDNHKYNSNELRSSLVVTERHSGLKI